MKIPPPKTFSKKTILLLLGIALGAYFWLTGAPKGPENFSGTEKTVTVSDERLEFSASSSVDTVGDFLREKNLNLKDGDQVIPAADKKIFGGQRISILRAKAVTILDGTEKKTGLARGETIRAALEENNIILSPDDLVSPDFTARLHNQEKITVIRVEIKEEKALKDIPFVSEETEDDKLGWRTRKITQPGEKGQEEITYRVVRHNQKEISRKIIERQVVKEPVKEIATQGTYMKLGKANTGEASYYASSWGELNASRTIPRRGYAKVTNLENGKSVVVKINDFGPQAPSRIIDLSYVSFSKIGDLGQGILHRVKVEQVLN